MFCKGVERGLCKGAERRLCKGAERGRRGAALVLALVAVLAATLLGVALMTNTGHLSGLAKRSAERSRAQARAEASLGLAVQKVLVRGDSAVGIFAWPGAAAPLAVRFDTLGIWMRAAVEAPLETGSLRLHTLLAKPLDSLLFRYGLVLLGSALPADSGALRLNGLLRSKAGVNPSAEKVRSQFSRLAEYVRTKDRETLTRSFADEENVHCRYTGNQRWWDAGEMPSCAPLRVVNGDIALESTRLTSGSGRGGVRDLRAQGTVTVRGNLHFDTLRVFAEGAVRLEGAVSAAWLEVFSKSTVTLGDQVDVAGLLVGEEGVVLEGEAQVRCCSFVLSGDTLDLLDNSRSEGYAMAVPGSAGGAGVVRITSRARALGVVYASGSLENQGFAGGTALAGQLGCGVPNDKDCVPDGEFDRDSMPVELRQSPLLEFGSPKRYVTLQRSVN